MKPTDILGILGTCCFAICAAALAIFILVVRDAIRRRQARRKLACPHCGALFGLTAIKEGERRGYEECEKEGLEALRPKLDRLGENAWIDINICHDLRIICPSCGLKSRYD